jgi:hypothetical protein
LILESGDVADHRIAVPELWAFLARDLCAAFWATSRPSASNKNAGQPGGIRSIPALNAILGDASSSEWEVVKRYVLRNHRGSLSRWRVPVRDVTPVTAALRVTLGSKALRSISFTFNLGP